jgi:uncharacterized membrane protein
MPSFQRHVRTVRLLVLLLAGVYFAYFSLYTCISHDRFKTYAFDLGTFDQGVWLAGHGTDYFVTVRGLHLLGDHVRLFSFVLAPLYWIWDDARALLVMQTLFIAAGAWFVMRISLREVPQRPWLALVLAAGYLLNPAVQNLNLDHAHPDAFAQTFLLAAIDALRGGRLAVFWIASALAMSCKEDVPLVFIGVGLVLLLDARRRRTGFVLATVATLYFALCVWVILPHFNGMGFFRFKTGGFLSSLGYHSKDPAWITSKFLQHENGIYLLQVGLAQLYLFVLAPLWLIPATAPLVANLLSDAQYMRDLSYHYQATILPFLIVATVDAVAKWQRPKTAPSLSQDPGGVAATPRFFLARAPLPELALLAAAVASNIWLSKVPLNRLQVLPEAWEMLKSDDRIAQANRLLARIPKDAVVAADYSLVPHLSHRRYIYMFPNPFEESNWGIHGEKQANPDTVEYVASRDVPGREPVMQILGNLGDQMRFERIATAGSIQLYRRVNHVPPAANATCGDWNGDGIISNEDLRWIAFAIMKKKPCPIWVCDIDGDRQIRYADVLRLGHYLQDPQTALLCPTQDGSK